MRISLRFITSLLLSMSAFASDLPISPAADAWAKLGPESGYMMDVSIDPSSLETVYSSAGQGGIYKSTNGGANWSAFNTGLDIKYVRAFAIDPVDPDILYAGTNGGGIYRYRPAARRP